MSDAAARNRRNRGAGKRWEAKLEADLRKDAGVDIERTRDSGEKDQGDGVIRLGGKYFVYEAKDAKVNMTDFCRQAEEEARNFAERRYLPASAVHHVVFIKRKGVSSAMEGFALLPIREYVRLAKAGVS